jgi:hypothetical protein
MQYGVVTTLRNLIVQSNAIFTKKVHAALQCRNVESQANTTEQLIERQLHANIEISEFTVAG